MLQTKKSSIKEQLNPLIQKLGDSILSHWQKYFHLLPYELPHSLGYVEGKLEGEKLVIENHCYQTPQFRKLHLELAKVGKNIDILHCVMFPKSEYSLPMFGCDIVSGKSGVSAAIVDLSPITPELQLSESYLQPLSHLPRISFSQPRELPSWADIFSDFCLFIRPSNLEEEDLFLSRVSDYLDIHCNNAVSSHSVSEKEQALNLAGQRYYCSKQQQNDKTRRLLEKAFGKDWADRYMKMVLFDIPDK